MLIARLKGTIPWLFDDTFCRWSDWHVCFNVGLRYNNAALLKRVVRTTCPDRFLGKEGPAPPGCVSTTVTALRTGARIEHHMIPASCLTPAAPKGKGDTCLILKGNKKGLIYAIAQCRTRKWEVVLGDGMTRPFDDVCLVIRDSAP